MHDKRPALPYSPTMALPLPDLTLPLPDAAASLRRVLAGVTRAHSDALRQAAVRHDRHLAHVLAVLESAGVLRPLLLRPNVSVLARVWLAVPDQRPLLRDRLIAALATEAALLGRLPEPIDVTPVAVGLPRLGWRIEPQDATALRIAHDGLHFQTPAGPLTLPLDAPAPLDVPVRVWPAYVPFHPALPNARLALADDNPLPIFYDHPKRRGNVVSLGDQPQQAWLDQLAFAVDHIAAHLPALLDEMRLLLGHVVPVGFLEEDHQSASYPHALGTIYLTLHPRPMMMLEALIHEFQHNKLHALMQLGPILVGDEDLRVASPVRPDPRPLRGVLLAVHAFLPVADLYRRLAAADDPLAREHWFAERYAAIRATNRAAWLTVQKHANWSPLALGLAEELARLDRALSEP